MKIDNFSIQGKGHKERGIPVQDASKADKLPSGYYLGIVADGVGSAPHADIGSKMAVESLFEYCEECIRKNSSEDEIREILLDGYAHALEQIDRCIGEYGAGAGDFDTTLSAVVYDEKSQRMVYSHVGDGGIIVRHLDGKVRPVTTRQKGPDGVSVVPLRAGKSEWETGTAEQVASVMLVTDGMLDGVFQPVLVNLPPNRQALAKGDFRKDHVYITAAEFFMNPFSVYLNREIKDAHICLEEFLTRDLNKEDEKFFCRCLKKAYRTFLGEKAADAIMEEVEHFCYTVWAVNKVTDDKSVVLLINEKVKVTPQSLEEYREPDWKRNREFYDALLYGKPMPETLPEKTLVREKMAIAASPVCAKTDLQQEERSFSFREKYGIIIVITACFLVAVAVFAFVFVRIFGKNQGEPEKPKDGEVWGIAETTLVPELPSVEEIISGNREEVLGDNTSEQSSGSVTSEEMIGAEQPLSAMLSEEQIEGYVDEFLEILYKIQTSYVSGEEKEKWKEETEILGMMSCFETILSEDGEEEKEKAVFFNRPDEGTEEKNVDFKKNPKKINRKKEKNNARIEQLIQMLEQISAHGQIEDFEKKFLEKYNECKKKKKENIRNILKGLCR